MSDLKDQEIAESLPLTTQEKLQNLTLGEKRLLLKIIDQPGARAIVVGSSAGGTILSLYRKGFVEKAGSFKRGAIWMEKRGILTDTDIADLREMVSAIEARIIEAKIKHERQPYRYSFNGEEIARKANAEVTAP